MATQPIYLFGDTANAVLNTARSRINDLILTPTGQPTGADPGQQLTQVGGGALLAELNDDGSLCLRTQIIFNSAWGKFQKYLANLGWRGLIDTITILSLPANTNPDPSIQSWLSWNGNFNGTTFASSPALPSEFYAPLKLRERLSNVSPIGGFVPMQTALDGLRNLPRQQLNLQWEWRKNALYFIGATQPTDLQIRCIIFFPDLVAVGSPSVPWYYQTLPIPGCRSALAWYIAYEVCYPRGDEPGAAAALANAESETGKILNDQARADQRIKQVNETLPRPTPSPEEQ